jgi:hypothetical protein
VQKVSKSTRSLPYLRLSIILIMFLIGISVYTSVLYKIFLDGFGSNFDDAYMFARYAQNLLNGSGFTWNDGMHPVYGPTSVPYVFIVALFMWFVPLGSNFLLPTISWIMGLISLALLGTASLMLTKRSPLPVAMAAMGCVVWVAISPIFIYHATTGMDTTLSILTNTFLVLAWVGLNGKPGIKRAFLLAVFAFLSFAVRPDNVIYALFFPLLALLLLESPAQWKEAFLFLAFLSSFIFIDILIKLSVFGDPFPLSYYVKQHDFYHGYLGEYKWNPITYLSIFMVGVMPSLMILITNLRLAHKKLAAAYLLPVILTILYYFRIVQIMGEQARYYYPALPFMVVLSLLLLQDIKKLPVGATFKKDSLRLLASTICLIGVILLLAVTAPKLYPPDGVKTASEAGNANSSNSNIPQIGWGRAITSINTVITKLPQGTVIAASEVGYIGANAIHVKIIDILGLNDPIIAHNGFSAAELIARKPDLIWFPQTDYAHIRLELVCSPELRSQYYYYPELFDYGIAIRKDSQHMDKIITLLREGIKIAYPNLNISLQQLEEKSLPAFCNRNQ